MGVIDAPQWLLPAFTRSVKAIGATQPPEAIGSAGELLIERWSTPDRRFHNLRHLIDMLARVDELAEESHNPDIMRVACWYHGCVFSSDVEEVSRGNGGEDETASAAFAEADLHHLGVPMETVKRVCCLIVNLKRHMLDEHDIDAQALIDADLGTLAVDPQTYAEYVRLLREEYSTSHGGVSARPPDDRLPAPGARAPLPLPAGRALGARGQGEPVGRAAAPQGEARQTRR